MVNMSHVQKNSPSWAPRASLETLKARADLLARARAFFFDKHILEIDTPLLNYSSGTDLHLHPVIIPKYVLPKVAYLQTSPEFAMKRLIAHYGIDIYQICKAFREEESGARHNLEFTMLEYYRMGYSLDELCDEVNEFMMAVINCPSGHKKTYQELFENILQLNPHTASIEQLRTVCDDAVRQDAITWDKATLRDWLFATKIEPTLGYDGPCYVFDFPAEQAALSQTHQRDDGVIVSKRFEIYMQGLELGNAYDELLDASTLRSRFEADNNARLQMNRPPIEIDNDLLAAMQAGLPACSGIAIGIDRLLMIMLNQADIRSIISFPLET